MEKLDDYTVIDVNPSPSIRGARFINLTEVNGPIDGIDKDEKAPAGMQKGQTRLSAAKIVCAISVIRTLPFWKRATYFSDVRVKNAQAAVSPEEITRVKALGFLLGQKQSGPF